MKDTFNIKKDHINISDLIKIRSNVSISIRIDPFEYKNGEPRLPRKKSEGYKLQEDTNDFFRKIFDELDCYSAIDKYEVNITVYKGSDRLGKGDLDNYCKAILDGITKTQKIWKDDKQVDKILVERKYLNNPQSYIEVEIYKSTSTL